VPGELEVGLVDERRGVPRLAGAHPRELAVGDPAQLRVEQRQQRVEGRSIAFGRGVQELEHLVAAFHRMDSQGPPGRPGRRAGFVDRGVVRGS
jgi:hypothetical protein